MSRSFLGAACALLVLVSLLLSGRLGAQEGAESPVDRQTATPVRHTAVDAEDRIDAVLDGRLKSPLELLDTPLTDVVNQLQEEYDIPILFDHAALDEVAISPETEISANLRNITLRSALGLMFRQPGLEDLTYIIDKEVLLITTEDRANDTLLTKVYRVDDFEHFSYGEKGSDKEKSCYSPLHSVIVSCIEFDSWQENGSGEGELHLMKPGLLVVAQTRHVHRQIEELLTKLRKVKNEIEAGSSGGGF